MAAAATDGPDDGRPRSDDEGDVDAVGRLDRAILGSKLRRLRLERGLSQEELGRATGISRSFLSLIEAGRSDITISRLLSIAEFYDMELTDVLGDRDVEQHPVRVLRADPERSVTAEANGVEIFDLAAGVRWVLRPVLTVVEPGGEVEISEFNVRETVIYVIEGTFEIRVGGHEPVRLERGDGALYRGGRDYRFRNVGSETARVFGAMVRQRPPS
jgi:transcriptional regulator with XRE-family HTH domain